MWNPIETAPKDGTKILVWTHHDDVEVSEWYVMNHDVYELNDDDTYTKRTELIHAGWNSNTPTHWQPLPEPPSEELAMTEPTGHEKALHYADALRIIAELKDEKHTLLERNEKLETQNKRLREQVARSDDQNIRLREVLEKIANRPLIGPGGERDYVWLSRRAIEDVWPGSETKDEG